MSNSSIVDQAYWNDVYHKGTFAEPADDNIIKKWIKKYVPNSVGDAIEIGVYPGTFLSIFGKMGYRVNGIDLAPGTAAKLPGWFKSLNVPTGDFVEANFTEHNFQKRQFDVVCSFGFIEHFKNWQEIILLHAQLTKPGGYLIIETPNFRGAIQRILHETLDKPNLKRHVLDSMRPKKWQELLTDEFEIMYCGYFGGFKFWVDVQKRSWIQEFVLKIIYKLLPYLGRITSNHSCYSPYCGLIARKKFSV